MNVLVTGANGFVGTALCPKLMQHGLSVRGASRAILPVGFATEQVVMSTFDDASALQAAVEGVDVVIHLAARVHVMHDNVADPLEAFCKANVEGSLKLAQCAIAAGVKRFVFVSSIGVNGSQTFGNDTFNERSTPNPHDDYSRSKFLAEKALKKLCENSNIELVILRPPLVYGPNPKGNFNTLLNVVSNLLPLPLGSIKNKRNFIFLGNLVDAVVVCSTHPSAANQTFLISDDEPVSTPKFIQSLATALAKPSMLFPFPFTIIKLILTTLGKSHQFDKITQSLVIDSSKIRHQLGWQPPFTMEEGLKITADWFKNARK